MSGASERGCQSLTGFGLAYSVGHHSREDCAEISMEQEQIG